eukprot:745853-Hanusia_phi.AAC.4
MDKERDKISDGGDSSSDEEETEDSEALRRHLSYFGQFDGQDTSSSEWQQMLEAITNSERARKYSIWSKSLLRATLALGDPRIPPSVKATYERQVAYYSRLLDGVTKDGPRGAGPHSREDPSVSEPVAGAS